MVLNFLFFTIKIERASASQRNAEYVRSRYLEKRAEAHAFEAAQLLSRI
ncbi:hypothetical protein [Brevibacillus choshinensis]|uniref:Uncharacterized protein n=1 Tax=Brevibacillus choshinensis TaxID=54911 RepID=A0ABX7FTB3_BRECH|nr:hypothetical protein [Brevibacillus choshinensis]QRG68512.1 hypothetical protein JNE38_04895 [Brevibacillus choshinensis]